MPLLSGIKYITSKVIREATLKHKSGWNTPEHVFFLGVWFVSLKGEKVSMTCAATYQQGAINVFWPLPRSPTAVNFLPAVCRQTTQQRPIRFQWEILQSPTAFMILPVTKRSRLRFLPATVRERMRRNLWTLAVLPVPEVCSIEIRCTKVKGIHTYSPPKLSSRKTRPIKLQSLHRTAQAGSSARHLRRTASSAPSVSAEWEAPQW